MSNQLFFKLANLSHFLRNWINLSEYGYIDILSYSFLATNRIEYFEKLFEKHSKSSLLVLVQLELLLAASC